MEEHLRVIGEDERYGSERDDVAALQRRGASAPAEVSARALPEDYSGARTDGRLIVMWLHGKSEKTKETYAYDLEAFRRFVGGRPLREITLSDLQEYAVDLAGADMFAPATQARMLACVKSLLSFGNDVRYLPVNVGKALKVPSRRDTLTERILTQDDVAQMVHVGARSERDKAMILLLYAAGLRREELCRLKWRDLTPRPDLGEGMGQLSVFGKGAKSTVVVLPPSVFRRLLALGGAPEGNRAPGPDQPLFKSRKARSQAHTTGGHLDPSAVNRVVSNAAKRAGLEGDVSPHWLRHSHATHAMERKTDIALVQRTLRHSSIATTGRYLHARPDDSSALHLGL